MELAYLLFDCSDEDGGEGSFDALASALPDRLPELLREVEAVLAWAHRNFGSPASGDEAGEWDFALQATDASEAPLAITFDGRHARVALPASAGGRVTIALTIGGSAAFAQAFRDAFAEAE